MIKMNEIFKDIKSWETEADKIQESGEKDKARIISDAKKRASKILSDNESELGIYRQEKIKECQKKGESLKMEKISEGEKEVKSLKAKAAKKIQKGVDFVLQKFDEEI